MFRKLTDKIYVAPQITIADVGEAAAQGGGVHVHGSALPQ